MKKKIALVAFVLCFLGGITTSLACSGHYYTCGDADQYLFDFIRNCPAGSTVTTSDVCGGGGHTFEK